MTYPQHHNDAYPSVQQPGTLPPSGGTAIAAGVLAILGGCYHLFGGLAGVASTDDAPFTFTVLLAIVANVLIAALLISGAVLLFGKKPAGRWLTIAGAGAALLLAVVAVIVQVVVLGGPPRTVTGFATGGPAVLVLVLVPAVVTIVLSALRPTARWVGRADPLPLPAGYYGASGYPQQHGYGPQSEYPPR